MDSIHCTKNVKHIFKILVLVTLSVAWSTVLSIDTRYRFAIISICLSKPHIVAIFTISYGHPNDIQFMKVVSYITHSSFFAIFTWIMQYLGNILSRICPTIMKLCLRNYRGIILFFKIIILKICNVITQPCFLSFTECLLCQKTKYGFNIVCHFTNYRD